MYTPQEVVSTVYTSRGFLLIQISIQSVGETVAQIQSALVEYQHMLLLYPKFRRRMGK